jgi:hypothetical protein
LLAIIATRDKKETKNNDDTLVEIINNDRSSVCVSTYLTGGGIPLEAFGHQSKKMCQFLDNPNFFCFYQRYYRKEKCF